MKPWVRYRGGHARYTGGITRPPFAAWLATPEGQTVLRDEASRSRFALLADARAARRLWRGLAAAAREPEVIATIQRQLHAYLGRLREFAYADGLPRLSVNLHRIVVVPRVLINGAAYGAIERDLRAGRVFASLAGGHAVRHFFIRTLIDIWMARSWARSRRRSGRSQSAASGSAWGSMAGSCGGFRS